MTSVSQNQPVLSNAILSEITSNVVTVSPELAKKWLEGMVENQRKPSERSVVKYSRAMSQGAWETASPLSFDSEGRLIDGQHRLLAVIRANRSVDFIVLRGLSKSAIHALDMGVNRTAAHLARLKGLSITNNHLAILNCCFYSVSNGGKYPVFSKQEQVYYAEKHFEALDFATKKQCDSHVSYSPYLAPVARAYYSENHKRLEQFLQVLHTGFTISENPMDDSAAIALRNLYFKNKGIAGRLNGGDAMRIQSVKVASNALANFILRKSVKVAKESSVNHFPVADFDEWWKDKQQSAA